MHLCLCVMSWVFNIPDLVLGGNFTFAFELDSFLIQQHSCFWGLSLQLGRVSVINLGVQAFELVRKQHFGAGGVGQRKPF